MSSALAFRYPTFCQRAKVRNFAFFYQYIFALNGINAVSTVFRVFIVSPIGVHRAKRDAIAMLRFDAIPRRIHSGKILQRNAIARNFHPFASRFDIFKGQYSIVYIPAPLIVTLLTLSKINWVFIS